LADKKAHVLKQVSETNSTFNKKYIYLYHHRISGRLIMRNSLKALIAVIVVIVVVVASVVILLPKHTTTPAITKQPGTSFVSTSDLNRTVGTGWSEVAYFSAGETNALQIYLAILHLEYGSYYSSVSSQIDKEFANVSTYVSGHTAVSDIVYVNKVTDSVLLATYLTLPNVTLAKNLYLNLTYQINKNTSIAVEYSNSTSSGYLFINASSATTGPKEGFLGYSSHYLIFFIYYTKNHFVPDKSMYTLFSDELTILGSTSLQLQPTNLVTSSQIESALGLDFNSSAYLEANVSNMTDLITALNSSMNTGVMLNSSTMQYTSNAYVENISAAGFEVFGNESSSTIGGAGFVTFKASAYASAIYGLLSTAISNNATVAPTYHSGTSNGEQYFYFSYSTKSFTNSSVNLSVLVLLDGNTIVFSYALSGASMPYTSMLSLASAQVSDM